ncbi:pectate lyase [Saccharophagus degradans]|uniref:pectate lyase n=1 Tax=Saccharophagus degradans TaxID=86304 RepID=UPI001C0970DA|nr:pectate lyase [Saccharophagus degradans]MBU2985207.1 pectate lyase [Saccharophagus degradans]
MLRIPKAWLALPLVLGSTNLYAQVTCSISNTNVWNNGYTVNVNVTNTGSSQVGSWQVPINFSEPPQVSSGWNAILSTNGNTVTAGNIGWNGNLNPGQSASFGFQGGHDGSFVEPTCSGGGSSTSSSSSSSSSSTSSTSSSSTSSSSSSSSGGSELLIQENASGFCRVDGSIDNNNSGYTGSGFANTENQNGSAVEYALNVPSNGNYLLDARYASATTRSASVVVNGSSVGSFSFPSTGSWTSWTVDSANVPLKGGNNIVRIVATNSSGLPNIDSLKVIGSNPSAGSCSSNSSSTSSSSSSSSSSSNSGGKGSSCRSTGSQSVSSTIKVTSGTFDGNCKTYNPTSALGDGSQSESQKPAFRVENGATLKNVILGNNGVDGIHVYNGGTLDNIRWTNVGEDAMTVKSEGNVTVSNIEGYDGSDKFIQVNAVTNLKVSNCIVDKMGKFLRQNGGKTFAMSVTVDNCDISNMGEGVFRSDSPNATARITNSRLKNAGDICIGKWKSCTSSNITSF